LVRISNDPTPDIYAILDEAQLGITKLNTPRPMGLLINEIRTDLAGLLREYIYARDELMRQAGATKGKTHGDIQNG
jgi:hypothetical protein